MDDLATIVVRFALYLDLMLLLGVPMFGLYALRGSERVSGAVLPFRLLVGLAALAGMALSAAALVLLAASMSGVAPGQVDREAIEAVVSGTAIGAAWQVRMAALLAALGMSLVSWRNPTNGLAIAVATGAVALASLAWTGHGAASEGLEGWVHLIGDIIHLLAAGAWIGALFALGFMFFRRSSQMAAEHVVLAHRTLDSFSMVGSLVVGLIILSGITNSWILIGPDNLSALFGSLYGQLLIAKLALFAAMLGLAWANRYRLTPALAASIEGGDHQRALSALRKSLFFEASAAAVILILVAKLGLLAPPMSGM